MIRLKTVIVWENRNVLQTDGTVYHNLPIEDEKYIEIFLGVPRIRSVKVSERVLRALLKVARKQQIRREVKIKQQRKMVIKEFKYSKMTKTEFVNSRIRAIERTWLTSH